MKGKPNPARQEYLRQWRKNHPEKIREYNFRYWDKKLQEYNAKKEKGEIK